MKIYNTKVYELAESLVPSKFPMSTEVTAKKFETEVNKLQKRIIIYNTESDKEITTGFPSDEFKEQDKYFKSLTSYNLSKVMNGSGHDNFLKGILVAFNIDYKQYWSQQVQRYHFIDFVSSQSKMHKIQEMVDRLDTDEQKQAVRDYVAGKIDIDGLMKFIPMSFYLSARMTTNYLQLKTIFSQRYLHTSKEWKIFDDWIENLPLSFLITDSYYEAKRKAKEFADLKVEVKKLREFKLDVKSALSEFIKLEIAFATSFIIFCLS